MPDSESPASSKRIRSNRVSAFILFVAIAGAPFPFGSTDRITIAFWCLLLGLGLMLASPSRLRAPHFALLAGIGVIAACFGFVLHEQLAEHPWIASPEPLWAQAAELLGHPMAPSVSLVRGEAFYALGAPLAAILALTLGLVVGPEREHARRALLVMAWAGAVYAIYGIVSLVISPTTLLWREKTAYVGSLTGTFINRNTAATYFGSCAAVWLILLMERVRGRLPRGPITWSKVPHYVLIDMPAGLALRLMTFFVCLAALLMTNSRAGVIVSLLVLVVAFMLFFRRDLPRARDLIITSVAAIAVVLIWFQFAGGTVNYRIDAQGLSDAGRLAAYRSTLRIIAEHPWFGTGLGTFAAVFPAYRSGEISMQGIWDRAHSTPLELAAELGLPLAIVVVCCWVFALVMLLNATGRKRRAALVPLAVLSLSLIASLHSLVDFSLQISGYTIVVFAMLGIGLAQATSADDERSDRPKREARYKTDADAERRSMQLNTR